MAESEPARIGFNPVTGHWGEDDGAPVWVSAPPLKGQLVAAPEELDRASRDQGNLAWVRPRAILRPAAAQDIAEMVRFCRSHGVKVAPRGASHSSFGQTLVDGLAIDMRSLNRIHRVTADSVDIEAGALWQDVVTAGFAKGSGVRTGVPAVLRLTIGGVLSVGGISTSRTAGALVDAVQELDVVTGTGELITCSPSEHKQLFESVLGGLGQFGIITRAQLEMVPVPPLVRSYVLRYEHIELRDALADQRILADRDEIDELLIRWQAQPDGQPIANLGVHVYYSSDSPPVDDQVMRGLSRRPATISDTTFLEKAESTDRRYAGYEANGWSDSLKVWYDTFLPDHGSAGEPRRTGQRKEDGPELTMEDVIVTVLEELTERDVSPTSAMLLFRKHRNSFSRPGLRLPDPALGDHVCLFDISSDTFGKPIDPTYAEDLKARNRRWYELARRAGGTRYPIGASDLRHEDWEQHYGDHFNALRKYKHEYDPDAILTPGAGIF